MNDAYAGRCLIWIGYIDLNVLLLMLKVCTHAPTHTYDFLTYSSSHIEQNTLGLQLTIILIID